MATKNCFEFATQMKKNGGYYYDILTNTLHITKDFEHKANRYGTTECRIMDELTLKNAAKPTIEVHIHKRKARLTYAMMEVFISKMPNAKANFEEYERVCQKSKIAKNPYGEVLGWFKEKFPHYEKAFVEADGKLDCVALNEYRKALEEQQARNNIIKFPEPVEASNEVAS